MLSATRMMLPLSTQRRRRSKRLMILSRDPDVD
jgi:hypothetical protein